MRRSLRLVALIIFGEKILFSLADGGGEQHCKLGKGGVEDVCLDITDIG